jgi:type I restriction enzyme S subunit
MVKYLRAANVKDGELDLTDVQSMNFTPNEQEVFALRRGDVLVTEGSGSLRSVGASAVWDGELEGTVCFQNTLLRLRPRKEVDGRYLMWWARFAFGSGTFASIATGANIFHVSAERVRALPIQLPSLDEQRRIADFLDVEIGKINTLIAKKTQLVARLEERINSRVLGHVGSSQLIDQEAGLPARPIRRLLTKVTRPAAPTDEVITAFRDGQVTARSLRRAEGYTLTASTEAQGQHVLVGDVVIHGLDGFAGAIGTSEAAGNCSPVYHVCVPRDGGDPAFYGRLLRVLAISGYLGLFATSTRERAVDFRSWELFGAIPIPSVALKEQAEIGAWVRAVPPLRTRVERSNALAAERRQALITAAVTGQIDVSTASGRGIEE